MANTYVKIATVTVGAGGAASISFSSITGTYTDLCLKVSARNDAVGNRFYTLISLNGSAASAINRVRLMGFDGANTNTTIAADSHNGTVGGTSTTSSTFSNSEIYLPNYSAAVNKTISSDSLYENNSATANTLGFWAGLWSSTAAITSIALTCDSGNFAQYSTATLYGIKNS
jgi:hypothetical protein